jgi:uncharacterized protein involved in cysteine biosynthesis
VASVLALYAVGFLFASAAAALDEALSLWLALLVVAVVILLLATVAGLVASRFAKKVSRRRLRSRAASSFAAHYQPVRRDRARRARMTTRQTIPAMATAVARSRSQPSC